MDLENKKEVLKKQIELLDCYKKITLDLPSFPILWQIKAIEYAEANNIQLDNSNFDDFVYNVITKEDVENYKNLIEYVKDKLNNEDFKTIAKRSTKYDMILSESKEQLKVFYNVWQKTIYPKWLEKHK